MKNIPIIILELSLLTGCMSAGTLVQPEDTETFRVNKTRCDDVIAKLGDPNETEQKDAGYSLVYVHAESAPNAAAFIPYVGFFAGHSDVKSHRVEFSCSKSGILTSIHTGDSNFRAGPAL